MIQPVINAAEHLGLAYAVSRAMARKENPVAPVEDTEAYADALLGLVQAANMYDPAYGTQFSTLGWRACKTRMIDSFRKRTRYREAKKYGVQMTSMTDLVAERIRDRQSESNVDLVDAVRRAVASLPDQLRLVVQMRMEGITQQEIADSMSRSVQRIQQLEVKAHAILAVRLKHLVEVE